MSLRKRLTVWLLGALLLVGSACALLTFVMASEETNSLLDYQMEEIARFLASQTFVGAAPVALIPRIEMDHDIEDDFIVQVRDEPGQMVYSSQHDLRLPAADWLGFRTLDVSGVGYRMFSARAGPLRILVAQQIHTRDEAATDAALSALLPVALLLPILGFVIGFAIRRGLAPLAAVAAGIAARPPLELKPLSGFHLPSEIHPLIAEINRLLERLSSTVQSEQRFIADAAHALRTPLAALQLQADVLETALPTGAEHAELRTRFDELGSGIRRSVRLADHLLAASRNEAADQISATVALDDALKVAAEHALPIAQSAGVDLSISLDAEIRVSGDRRSVLLIAGNLIDNALRHSPKGGRAVLQSRIEAAVAVIQIIDEGPGLPPGELDRVFERFYRVPGDPTEGSGLGLSAVYAGVQCLGGSVSLRNRNDRSGLIARVCLPVAN